MKVIYLKKTRRDIHIALNKKYLFKRKYIDNNSGKLQTKNWEELDTRRNL